MANRRSYEMPADLPAAACGRCMWFDLRDSHGHGQCYYFQTPHNYNCIPCAEYEPNKRMISRQ